MEIVLYNNSQAYVFPNTLSDRLIINIDGSGWDSALGTKNEKKWPVTHEGAQLLQVLRDRYTFFIPEKFNRQPGFEYPENIEDREKYTADNLLACYLVRMELFGNFGFRRNTPIYQFSVGCQD